MDNESDVRLVDAHPESDSGADDVVLALLPFLLDCGAIGLVHAAQSEGWRNDLAEARPMKAISLGDPPCMIVVGVDAELPQSVCRLFA